MTKKMMHIQGFHQMIKNLQTSLPMRSNRMKNNPMEWKLHLRGILSFWKRLKDYVIHVINQSVQFFVLEFVEDLIIKSVMKKYLIINKESLKMMKLSN